MVAVPVPRPAQAPAVDDIADEVQVITTDPPEDVRRQVGAARTQPQMDVGDENAAVAVLRGLLQHDDSELVPQRFYADTAVLGVKLA